MNAVKNGETQKKRGRVNDSIHPDTSERLEYAEKPSGVYGTQQDGFNKDDCSGENIVEQANGGNISLGKILDRLKRLESEYLAYVGEHQERLETRLEESKRRETQFRQDIRQLEQDIKQLMSKPSD